MKGDFDRISLIKTNNIQY